MMLELACGQQQCVRRSSRRTVTGEMGFFRQARRTASVIAETPATVYSRDRENFDRLQHDHPAIYDSLLHFVIRLLSDRLDLSTAELSSMRYVDINEMPLR